MTKQQTVYAVDCETTGLDAATDRIVELSIIKVDGAIDFLPTPNDPVDGFNHLINPGRPIPPETTAIHGITDEMVAKSPSFSSLADLVYERMKGAHVIIAYNARFDLGFIEAELGRAGYEYQYEGIVVDPLALWRREEPRDLEAAIKRFTPELAGQTRHRSAGDACAAAEVFWGMAEVFGLEGSDWAGVQDRCFPDRKHWIGPTPHFQWKQGEAIITVGKNQGKTLAWMAKNDPGYLKWIMRSDFPRHAREIASWALEQEPQSLYKRLYYVYGGGIDKPARPESLYPEFVEPGAPPAGTKTIHPSDLPSGG